ncbi:MAG: FHA domain-containing protein [Peptoniphilaceae bacterium]|nr:FHA domain-containing protein [Peptoniphilaceae bacterium]MDY6085877.1 FHA domain-containing protein [Peptoniphilaceae bacterium]
MDERNTKPILICPMSTSAGCGLSIDVAQSLEIDPVAIRMLEDNAFQYWAVPKVEYHETGTLLTYDCAGQSFYAQPQPWTQQTLIHFLEHLTLACDELENYLIDVRSAVWSLDALRLKKDGSPILCLTPFSNFPSETLPHFLEEAICIKEIDTGEDTAYLARMLNGVKARPFTTETLKTLCAEERKEIERGASRGEEDVTRGAMSGHVMDASAEACQTLGTCLDLNAHRSLTFDDSVVAARDVAEPLTAYHANTHGETTVKFFDNGPVASFAHAPNERNEKKQSPEDEDPIAFLRARAAQVKNAEPVKNGEVMPQSSLTGHFDSKTPSASSDSQLTAEEGEDEHLSLFGLLTHFSKENLMRYRAQRDADEGEKPGLIWEEHGSLGAGTMCASQSIEKESMPLSGPRLRFENGTEVSLQSLPAVLGRDAHCDIVVNERSVSMHHARLYRSHEHVYLTDLRSTAGTAINRKSLLPLQSYALEQGDRISFGSTEALFLY